MKEINYMSVEEMELELKRLDKKKTSICKKYENGKLSDIEAQKLYESISTKYNDIHREIQKHYARSYDNFIQNIIKGVNK